MRVLAIMPVRNEVDILPWTVRHLAEQGIDVWIIENWSTDGTAEILSDLPIVGWERFPASGPENRYNCRQLLQRVDEVAAASDYPWCIYHDADEIRRSPRQGETLRAGIARVERDGDNAINHALYLFPPTDNLYVGDPERHFRYYTTAHCDCGLNHVKAWRNSGRLIGLGTKEAGGGHRMGFPGMRVHPEKWILKHYPIRSQAHGVHKCTERIGRWNREERAWGWHVQYDGLGEHSQFVQNAAKLKLWTGP